LHLFPFGFGFHVAQHLFFQTKRNMNSQQLDQLLTKLSSQENELRSSGEKELDQYVQTSPGELLVGLANMIVLHPNVVVIYH
jgi:hypothetical protein